MHHHRRFTLLEMAIVVVVLIGITLPLLIAAIGACRNASKPPHRPPLVYIARSLVLWSDQFYQQTGEFPRTGLVPPPPNYTIASNSPTDRIASLCNMGSDPLYPSMLINPVGIDTPATGTAPTIVLHANNLSYAVLDAENFEWKNRTNASAPILADKQVGRGSFWNKKYWEGTVGWGDTHATYETPGAAGTNWPTTNVNGHLTVNDNLFTGTTGPTATDTVLINP